MTRREEAFTEASVQPLCSYTGKNEYAYARSTMLSAILAIRASNEEMSGAKVRQ